MLCPFFLWLFFLMLYQVCGVVCCLTCLLCGDIFLRWAAFPLVYSIRTWLWSQHLFHRLDFDSCLCFCSNCVASSGKFWSLYSISYEAIVGSVEGSLSILSTFSFMPVWAYNCLRCFPAVFIKKMVKKVHFKRKNKLDIFFTSIFIHTYIWRILS